jgi:hypothetical protein
MAAAGLSLLTIGKVLGHSRPETTARYTPLVDQSHSEAARIMGEQMERSTREGAERLRRKRAGDGTVAAVIPLGDANVIRFPGKPWQ